jgi:TonB family protein
MSNIKQSLYPPRPLPCRTRTRAFGAGSYVAPQAQPKHLPNSPARVRLTLLLMESVVGMKNKNVAGCPWPGVAIAMTSIALLFPGARAADAPVEGSAATAEPVDVEVFQPARPLTAPTASAYPWKEMNQHREGWVVLNMMISPRGRPYEVSVLDSSGNPDFDRAAVKALDQMTFEPARSAGAPVDSSLTFRMAFSWYGNSRGASPGFIAAYRDWTKAFASGDRAQVETQFAKLKAENIYEAAIRSFAQSVYDEKWGTEEQQLADLRRALDGDEQGQFLSRKLFSRALISKLLLEAKSGDYGSALNTWNTLKPVASADVLGVLQPTVNRIIALRNSDQVIHTPGTIDSRLNTWSGYLFRNRFTVSVSNGAVSEIKLRCKKTYVFFKYEANVQYTVNPAAGECGVEVLGNPGTTFNLIQ